MKIKFQNQLVAIIIAMLSLCVIHINAQSPKTVRTSEAVPDKQTIENIVREYLLKNPSIIREAMQALQAQEEKERQERAANNLKSLKKDIYSDPDSPTAGNPNGEVSIAVFFDYQCGYCKKSLPALKELLSKDPSVRIVYKELPILGPESQMAARAALAANRQGKYTAFHDSLIASGEINEVVIERIATQLGLNYSTLQKDMHDQKIKESLERNYSLATSLEINGTPAYVVGGKIIPGAIDVESLAKIVSNERKLHVKVTF